MRKKIINLLKTNSALYSIYYYCGSALINILKWFIAPDPTLVLFVCYGGKSSGDSPRAIYECMKKDPRCKKFHFVWAFIEPEKHEIESEKIKIDTVRYVVTALRARCWITNSGVARGLNFKGKNTICLNTWHGTPMKRIGSDAISASSGLGSKKINETDFVTAQGEFEAEIFSRIFNIDKKKVIVCGLPRNDVLTRSTQDDTDTIKKHLGIPADKKVVLYAPTFREYVRDSENRCIFGIDVDFNVWKAALGDDYVILLRAHYEVAPMDASDLGGFVTDVSAYEDVNDLYIAADMLVSDYSGTLVDYSLLGKPMICFAPDYEEFAQKRGFYFDIFKEFPFPIAQDEQTLLTIIKNTTQKHSPETEKFCRRFIEKNGNAAQLSVDFLMQNIGE